MRDFWCVVVLTADQSIHTVERSPDVISLDVLVEPELADNGVDEQQFMHRVSYQPGIYWLRLGPLDQGDDATIDITSIVRLADLPSGAGVGIPSPKRNDMADVFVYGIADIMGGPSPVKTAASCTPVEYPVHEVINAEDDVVLSVSVCEVLTGMPGADNDELFRAIVYADHAKNTERVITAPTKASLSHAAIGPDGKVSCVYMDGTVLDIFPDRG